MNKLNKYIDDDYQKFFDNDLSKTDPDLFNTIKKELERQSLLKGISVKKKKNKKKADLTEWEEKLKQIEESK